MAADTVQRFVEAWGAMGSLWGINRSVARVHALLMASDGPISLDEIAERLQISKGNASMSLRELRTFGVVRQVEVPGDRRDFYVTEPDVWTMFFRILKERKRREFDPAIDAIRTLVEQATDRLQGGVELPALPLQEDAEEHGPDVGLGDVEVPSIGGDLHRAARGRARTRACRRRRRPP